ncbi:glucose-1-phosphate adenylyltransferase family protein [Nostocoides veronense]|uniref:Glucose-1-phosphate adenylyltransferase family protein n=2 Tax=Nostocoides veronense TaxID=330836 RepID=A0ABN2LM29_9MICO
MDVLTRERAKPALPFAGSYQLIDFALSNLANSGIPDVWVSVQYQAASLDEHLASGRPWDLDRTRGGYRRLVPEEGDSSGLEGFSTGNADDLMRMADDIAAAAPDVVVVTSADHIFRLDVRSVIEAHLSRRAECTVVTTEVSLAEAKHKAVVRMGRGRRVAGIDYKPSVAASGRIATEIFVYDAPTLLRELDALRRDRAAVDPGLEEGLGDFGEHLLPRLVARGRTDAYALEGYWKDLGRPSAYLAAHRDLLRGRVDVFDDPRWPILTRFPELPPARVGASGSVDDSLLSPGVVVDGMVRGSVLGPGCVIEAGARVEDCVLMAGVRVESGAVVAGSVLDQRVVIEADAVVGAVPRRWPPSESAVTLCGADSRIRRGTTVPAGARLEPGSTS